MTAESNSPKPTILILCPMGDSVPQPSVMSLNKLCMTLISDGFGVQLLTTCSMAHAKARNVLASMGYGEIKQGNVTHVLWLDSDQIYEPQDVYKLMFVMKEFNLDTVSATYFTKNNDPKAVALTIQKYTTSEPREPIAYQMINKLELNMLYEVDAVGFGMFLMKPEVITEIYDKFGESPFAFPVREGQLIGEDIVYCEKIKSLGKKVHIHTGVLIGHVWNTNMTLTMAKLISSHQFDFIDGWLTEEEGLLLQSLAAKSTTNVVEIGSFKGKSTIFIARGLIAGAKGSVYAIDPHTGSPEHVEAFGQINTLPFFQQNIINAGVDKHVIPIVKTSEEAAKEFNEQIDLVFIDGDHSSEAFRLDFTTWDKFLTVGGAMALHDSSNENIAAIINNEILPSGRYKIRDMVGSITVLVKQ